MTTNDKLSDEALQAARDRAAQRDSPTTHDDRGPQSGETGKAEDYFDGMPLSEALYEAADQLAGDGPLFNILLSKAKALEAERTKLHELLGRMAVWLKNTEQHDDYCPKDNGGNTCTCGFDRLLADYQALTKP